jgi:uncharacterized protein
METTILILPGIGNSGPEHWQSHWERRDPRCQRVLQDEWDSPVCADWVRKLNLAVTEQVQYVVLVAHSSACALVAHWASAAEARCLQKVEGALLVAPSDPLNPHYPSGPMGFGPMPSRQLPFPTIVVASSDDYVVEEKIARGFAEAWGARFVLLQSSGHINAVSGFGPWPEGYDLLRTLIPETSDAS